MTVSKTEEQHLYQQFTENTFTSRLNAGHSKKKTATAVVGGN